MCLRVSDLLDVAASAIAEPESASVTWPAAVELPAPAEAPAEAEADDELVLL